MKLKEAKRLGVVGVGIRNTEHAYDLLPIGSGVERLWGFTNDDVIGVSEVIVPGNQLPWLEDRKVSFLEQDGVSRIVFGGLKNGRVALTVGELLRRKSGMSILVETGMDLSLRRIEKQVTMAWERKMEKVMQDEPMQRLMMESALVVKSKRIFGLELHNDELEIVEKTAGQALGGVYDRYEELIDGVKIKFVEKYRGVENNGDEENDDGKLRKTGMVMTASVLGLVGAAGMVDQVMAAGEDVGVGEGMLQVENRAMEAFLEKKDKSLGEVVAKVDLSGVVNTGEMENEMSQIGEELLNLFEQGDQDALMNKLKEWGVDVVSNKEFIESGFSLMGMISVMGGVSSEKMKKLRMAGVLLFVAGLGLSMSSCSASAEVAPVVAEAPSDSQANSPEFGLPTPMPTEVADGVGVDLPVDVMNELLGEIVGWREVGTILVGYGDGEEQVLMVNLGENEIGGDELSVEMIGEGGGYTFSGDEAESRVYGLSREEVESLGLGDQITNIDGDIFVLGVGVDGKLRLRKLEGTIVGEGDLWNGQLGAVVNADYQVEDDGSGGVKMAKMTSEVEASAVEVDMNERVELDGINYVVGEFAKGRVEFTSNQKAKEFQTKILMGIWSSNRAGGNELFNENGIYANVDDFVKAAQSGIVSGVWLVKPVADSETRYLMAEYYEAGDLDLRSIEIAIPLKPKETMYSGGAERLTVSSGYIPLYPDSRSGAVKWEVEDGKLKIILLRELVNSPDYHVGYPLTLEDDSEENLLAINELVNAFLINEWTMHLDESVIISQGDGVVVRSFANDAIEDIYVKFALYHDVDKVNDLGIEAGLVEMLQRIIIEDFVEVVE